MSSQSILDFFSPAYLENFDPSIRQAIEAAIAIAPQVGARFTTAVDIVRLGDAILNPDGSVTIKSRLSGPIRHLNGSSCDCIGDDRAPIISGKRACTHQVAAWIVIKAARLTAAAKSVEVGTMSPAGDQPGANHKSCWCCGSTSFADVSLRGGAGRCRYCGAQMPETTAAQTNTPAEQLPTVPDPAPVICEHLTIAQLTTAAGLLNGHGPYVLEPTYIGGHGYAQILQAETDPQAHEFYLIGGDWHSDELFVAQWGDHWGEIDRPAMQQFATALAPTITADPSPDDAPIMKPVVAYYLETSAAGIKIMVTHGQAFPKCVKIIGDSLDRNEQAAALAEARAAALAAAFRNATPGAEIELRRALLPGQWRNRMGGDQIGKAWVVYAQQPLHHAAWQQGSALSVHGTQIAQRSCP